MDIKDIPLHDIQIIEEVADHVSRNTKLKGYSEEDLRQELVIIGMNQYVRSWDESKQVANQKEKRERFGKVQSRRDNNLFIYMKTLLKNRTHNIQRGLDTKKRGGDITVTSIDPQDSAYEGIFGGAEETTLNRNSFEGLGLSDDQIEVLMYIAGNDLGKSGAQGSTKKTMVKDTGLSLSRIEEIMGALKDNTALRDLLINRV